MSGNDIISLVADEDLRQNEQEMRKQSPVILLRKTT